MSAAAVRSSPGLALDELTLAQEISRMRHHAELCAMMCLHARNAVALATEICRQMAVTPSGHTKGHPAAALDCFLEAEQDRLVREACDFFGHGARCASLPVSSVQECLK